MIDSVTAVARSAVCSSKKERIASGEILPVAAIKSTAVMISRIAARAAAVMAVEIERGLSRTALAQVMAGGMGIRAMSAMRGLPLMRTAMA